MGVYYDLGRPIIGGWMGGPWVSHDPVRHMDLIWGGEFGQEGAVLFAIDADSGNQVEHHHIGAREFGVLVDPETGRLWIYNCHGLFQSGNILQSWNPQTRTIVSHGFPPLSNQRFAGGLWGPDRRLYLGTHPFGHLVSFDPFDETWHDHGCQAPKPIHPGQQIWCTPQWITEAGEIICSVARTRPGYIVAFSPATGTTRTLTEPLDRPPVASPPNPRRIVANIETRTYTVDGVQRSFDYTPSVATDICGLNPGPDGKIYGSTIISMHVFSYDSDARSLIDLGRVGWGHGEVYDVISHKGKVYMGSYTGAYWGVYDPAKPWHPSRDTLGEGDDANPRCLGQLGQDMNRPFEYAVGPDDRIYLACRANYGLTGGGLGVYDTRTETLGVHRDNDQSVQCVTADNRFVYGGTSVSGGRGCLETTTEGKLFLFDTKAQRRVYECIPVPGAVAVTSLAVSPINGTLFGTTSSGHLFAFSVEERQVIKKWKLRSEGTPLMGVPETYGIIHLTSGSDGAIYGVTRQDLFKLDMSTDQILYLDQPPISDLYQIVEGRPGVFYIGARGHLLEYHLKDTPHYR